MKRLLFAIFAILLVGCTRSVTVIQDTPPPRAHGEMYTYNTIDNLFTFVIPTAGEYHNMTNLTEGHNLGFSFFNETELNGGSYLQAHYDGTYKICSSMSFSSQAQGGLYGISISRNFDHTLTRDCYTRRTASGDVGNVGLCCVTYLEAGDTLNMKIENENTNRDMNIHTININAVVV